MSAERFSLTKRILEVGETFGFGERLRFHSVSEARCPARLGLVAVLRLSEPLLAHLTLRRWPVHPSNRTVRNSARGFLLSAENRPAPVGLQQMHPFGLADH